MKNTAWLFTHLLILFGIVLLSSVKGTIKQQFSESESGSNIRCFLGQEGLGVRSLNKC